MECDRPHDDAYGRVTNPERYRRVVDAARTLIDRLVSEFDVEVAAAEGGFRVGSHDWGEPGSETVHLTPTEGAPISFVFTDFPGVFIRFGELEAQAFPACGCDACHDAPESVIDRMYELVEAVVRGRYEEELTRSIRRASFHGPWGESAGRTRLEAK